tara:strand:+ start:250 stop:750 length:501 start_codon:yes stop_codon:yes gene_type:complete
MELDITDTVSLEINKENSPKIKKDIIDIKELIDQSEYSKVLKEIYDIADDIYNELGTGFSEYIYHRSFEVGLQEKGLKYESKKIIPVYYKERNVGYGEADLVVQIPEEDKKIIIELKAIYNNPRELEIAQVKTYLKYIKNSCIGVLINFPQPGTKEARKVIDFKLI